MLIASFHTIQILRQVTQKKSLAECFGNLFLSSRIPSQIERPHGLELHVRSQPEVFVLELSGPGVESAQTARVVVDEGSAHEISSRTMMS
jgi:hypothetical protein